MNAPIATPRLSRPTAWESLCTHYCRTYGIKGADLFSADRLSRHCFRARGPGAPSKASRYPGLIVAQTLPFLLLASQRRTSLSIDQIAECLYLDEWDALEATAEAESRLATDPVFALAFEQFLDALDSDSRAQSRLVQETRAMTHEEIGRELSPPVSWQRVQQIEKRALKKLRESGMLDELMEGLRG